MRHNFVPNSSMLDLKELKKIFAEMWNYYDFYLTETGDLPYWSTEMSNVGNFAVAAARLKKYPLLLEYNTEGKGRTLGKYKRPDLWLQLSSKKSYLVEAKQCWLGLIDKDALKDDIKDYFSEAGRQLKKVPKESSRLLALFFVPVYMRKRHLYEKQIEKYLEILRVVSQEMKSKISFYAYYFIDQKKLSKAYWKKEKYYYPGVAIFGKIRKA